MGILDFLQENLDENMSLDDLIEVFRKMCNIKVNENRDLIYVDASTISVDGRNVISFSLIRQFNVDSAEEDQVQVELAIILAPVKNLRIINDNILSSETYSSIDEFFNDILSSDVYVYLIESEAVILEYEVYFG